MINILKLLPIISVFIISVFLYSIFIYYFNKLKIGQSVREEGLESHKVKEGTATLGGIIFIIVPIVFYTIFYKIDGQMLFVIISFLLYGIIGFIDDYMIIRFKNNKGISPLFKYILQCLIAILLYYLIIIFQMDTSITILNYEIEMGFFYAILLLYLFPAGSNAVNLTDGVDGLVGSLMIINLVFVIFICSNKGYDYQFLLLILGSLSAFLLFNYPKASIFMGNVGAYGLGSLFIAILIYAKEEIAIIFFGIMFIFETLSVVLQVFYFKKTKGKRLFKMAPYHHHLELKGYTEKQIIYLFALIQITINIIYMVIR